MAYATLPCCYDVTQVLPAVYCSSNHHSNELSNPHTCVVHYTHQCSITELLQQGENTFKGVCFRWECLSDVLATRQDTMMLGIFPLGFESYVNDLCTL